MPEDHPLAVRGPWKKPFTGRADVVLAIGFKFWSGEHFGAAPTWNEQATYIQVDATPARIGWQVPAEVALRRRSEAGAAPAHRRGAPRAGARRRARLAPGAAEVATARANFDRMLDEREQRHRGARRRSIPTAWRASSAA